jgi:hypothetical protein
MGSSWFEVDKTGLSKVASRRGMDYILHELVSNAWDTNATQVRVSMHRSRGRVDVSVEDNDPAGFADLTDAFTLYRDTPKRGDPEVRGRFNIGEKEVLASCVEAEVVSTSGCVRFNKSGTRTMLRSGRRPAGTMVNMTFLMSEQDFLAISGAMARLLPPGGKETWFNGSLLPSPREVLEFQETLPTELADEQGRLRPARRLARVSVLEATEPWLYEMGVPVCALPDDKWSINVHQKVPLPRDRDSVSPKYLQSMRVAVLNHCHALLARDDAGSAWAKAATSDERVEQGAFQDLLHKRFGDKVVSHDPSDQEANKRAVSEGYVVVSGGSLSREEWENSRKFGAMEPAGRVFPSRPEATAPGRYLAESELTAAMRKASDYARMLAQELMGAQLRVRFIDSKEASTLADYSRGEDADTLRFNVPRLGSGFLDDQQRLDALIIHEFGHHYSSDHLSREYYDALCLLGARLKALALRSPGLFT